METEFTLEEIRKIVREVLVERKKRKAAKNKGPSKKTAQKILRGTKTFKQKVQRVKGFATKNPAGMAAYLMKKATGKWPSEK